MVQHADIDHTGLTGVPAAGIPATILDAKGDLIAASAADTAAKVTVGANGSSLRANSGASAGVEWQLNKYDATVAPTANEDTGDGYSVGSIWIDVTGDAAYICVDASTAAAVWIPFDSASGESWEGAWSAGTYTTGQIVEHNDVIYQANTTTTDEPPSGDWDVLYTAPGGGSSSYAATILAHADILRFWGFDEPSGTTTHDDEVGSDDLADFGSPIGRSAGITRDTDTGRDVSFCKNGSGMGAWRAAGGYTWPAAWTLEAVVSFLAAGSDSEIFGQWNGAGAMLHLSGTVLTAYFGGNTSISWDAGSSLYGRHHVAIGHDGTDGFLYFDGVQRDTGTVTGPTSTGGGNFMVGGYSGSGTAGLYLIQALAYYDAWIGATDLADHADLAMGT